MSLPKSFGEANQRKITDKVIEWDGDKTAGVVEVPLAVRPVHIAVDNGPNTALAMTLAHLLRYDDGYASVEFGSGSNGVVTLTADAAGPAGDKLSAAVVTPPEGSKSTELVVEIVGQQIVITLATTAAGALDDAKNTAGGIVAAINDETDGIEGITASASGDGSGIFQAAVEAVSFSGGVVPVWASLYDSAGDAVSITIAAESKRVYGPFPYFPRFRGGKITLTASSAPADESITVVQVIEG